jgi:hypothetical protein
MIADMTDSVLKGCVMLFDLSAEFEKFYCDEVVFAPDHK